MNVKWFLVLSPAITVTANAVVVVVHMERWVSIHTLVQRRQTQASVIHLIPFSGKHSKKKFSVHVSNSPTWLGTRTSLSHLPFFFRVHSLERCRKKFENSEAQQPWNQGLGCSWSTARWGLGSTQEMDRPCFTYNLSWMPVNDNLGSNALPG